MVSWIVDQLLKLNPWLALGLVFLLPALEASIFLGFVLPGETAVVVGGFLAYEGKIPLYAVFLAARGVNLFAPEFLGVGRPLPE